MNAIDLLVTSGNGPVECRIALTKLLGILEREAIELGCSFEANLGPMPDRHGAKSAIISLDGLEAERIASGYCGSIRFTFKSPVRLGHKRQNWYVGVQRIEPGPEGGVVIDPADLRFETLRAGGPGGQHQNTTDSAVRILHRPTGLMVTARDERSQHRNKAQALRRLEAMLHQIEVEKQEVAKSGRFIANRTIERGNEVKAFKL